MELVLRDIPSGKLAGDSCFNQKGFHREQMKSAFEITRVHGHVSWRDFGSYDHPMRLIIKRAKWKGSRPRLGELDLIANARISTAHQLTTAAFDLKPNAKNPFWQRGTKGKFLS